MEPRKRKLQLNRDFKGEGQVLRGSSLGLLYGLLSALNQAEKPKNSPHLNFEKEFCIKKIITRLENSADPVELLGRAQQFLRFSKAN
jgi:hypothetical protein